MVALRSAVLAALIYTSLICKMNSIYASDSTRNIFADAELEVYSQEKLNSLIQLQNLTSVPDVVSVLPDYLRSHFSIGKK